jgi:hypothetical protein
MTCPGSGIRAVLATSLNAENPRQLALTRALETEKLIDAIAKPI